MTTPLYKLTAEKLCPDFKVKRKDCPCENCGFILSELHTIWLELNQDEDHHDFQIDQDLNPTID